MADIAKIMHGSLKFAGAGQATFNNLHVERLATDPALADLANSSRIWFNTTDGHFKYSVVENGTAKIEKVASATDLQQAIDTIMGGVPPEALNSLKEIADALQNNPDIYNVLVGLMNTKVDTLRTDLTTLLNTAKTELEASITALDGRLTTVEGQTNGKIGDLSSLATSDKSTIVNAINSENADRKADVLKLTQDLQTEATRADTAEKQIRTDIKATQYTFKSTSAQTSFTLNHGLNSEFVDYNLVVKGTDGKYRNDFVVVTEVDNNTLYVEFIEPQEIKIFVHVPFI